MSTTAAVEAVLDQIQSMLIAEAERALLKAELYSKSKRQGERNSVRVYLERGEAAVQAAIHLEDRLASR